MISIGVIGYGYWGPNIVRNFNNQPEAEVRAVCDLDQKALGKVRESYPWVRTTNCCEDILTATDIDAVAIITPVSTHFALAKRALENGKHIFIEKPFTASVAEAEQLIELAERQRRIIMVDHTFLFCGAVKKIRELIDEDVLGDLYYFDSIRINLGLFQKDVNVVWDLAPHDLSIMLHLIGRDPVGVAATGISHFDNEIENVAYITVYFPGNLIAHCNISWLSPVKIRTTLIGGQKKMIVWNDLVADEKIRVYDRGVEGGHDLSREKSASLRTHYRMGDVWSPRFEETEALRSESKYFLDCVANDARPLNDGVNGLKVVGLLESAVKSLKMGGAVIYL